MAALRQRHHEDALRHHIEELADRGWTFIPWASLYRWYDAGKIAKRVWRDLRERFLEEVSHDYKNWDPAKKDLWVYSGKEGAMLLHFHGLHSIADMIGEPAVVPEPVADEEEGEEVGVPAE